MPNIVPDEIEEYARDHTSPPPPLLAALAEETRRTLTAPQMLTGPVEGRFLQFLVWAANATRVLEIGTYSGYSSISMAAALPDGGRIDTCEVNEEHAAVARRYIAQAGYEDRIRVHVGDALETLARLQGPWDLVFIDADKVNYGNYFAAALPSLAPRGLIVADNVLWSGRVLDEDDGTEETKALKAFTEQVLADERVESVLLTVRDGVLLIRRAG